MNIYSIVIAPESKRRK